MPTRPMPPTRGLFEVAFATLVAVMGMAVLGVFSLADDTRQVPVGMILAFDTQFDQTHVFQVRVPATENGRPAPCFLTGRLLHSHPGSLLVTSVSASQQDLSVHWIGGETASGPDSCGKQADLSMTVDNFVEVSRAADRFY